MIVALVVVSTAVASERSEVLTARGEVAAAQGHSDEAVRLLEQAVVADPDDAGAHSALGSAQLSLGHPDAAAEAFQRALALDPTLPAAQIGLARTRGDSEAGFSREQSRTTGELGRLSSVRNAGEEKPWSLSLTTGFQYDSNVTVTPNGPSGTGTGKQDDGAWVAGVTARYDLIQRPDFLLRFEYDFYQTLHFDISDFDFRSQQPRLTASYGLTPSLWVGTQGGYNYYSLGPRTYQGEPYVLPFVSYLEGTWGLTQLLYRWGEDTYFSTPFNGVRDGPNQSVNLGQTFYLSDDRYVTVGYQWNNENPKASTCTQSPPVGNCAAFGNDWEFSSNQGYVGVGSPLVLGAYLDLLYLFRSDDYRWRNSYANYTKRRQDYGNYLYTAITRPITEHVAVALTYYGTFNGSNIGLFEYNRNVVGAMLQLTY